MKYQFISKDDDQNNIPIYMYYKDGKCYVVCINLDDSVSLNTKIYSEYDLDSYCNLIRYNRIELDKNEDLENIKDQIYHNRMNLLKNILFCNEDNDIIYRDLLYLYTLINFTESTKDRNIFTSLFDSCCMVIDDSDDLINCYFIPSLIQMIKDTNFYNFIYSYLTKNSNFILLSLNRPIIYDTNNEDEQRYLKIYQKYESELESYRSDQNFFIKLKIVYFDKNNVSRHLIFIGFFDCYGLITQRYYRTIHYSNSNKLTNVPIKQYSEGKNSIPKIIDENRNKIKDILGYKDKTKNYLAPMIIKWNIKENISFEKFRSTYKYSYIHEYVGKPKVTFSNYIGNNNPRSFDIIRVELPLISKRFSREELIQKIKIHKNEIDKLILSILSNNSKFKKFGVPTNFLKLTDMVVTSQDILIYTFELKINNPQEEIE